MFDSIAKVFSDFGVWIVNWILYVLSYAAGVVYAFGKYIINGFVYLYELTLYPLFSILESILGALNIDYMVASVNSFLTSSGFGYFADLFMIDDAIYATFTALLLRFVIRRIPFIG